MLRELADRRRFSCSVDAGKHDHERARPANDERPFQRQQQLDERLLEQRARIRFRARSLPARAQIVEQASGRRDAHVGADQRALQFGKRFLR